MIKEHLVEQLDCLIGAVQDMNTFMDGSSTHDRAKQRIEYSIKEISKILGEDASPWWLEIFE
jgi:hypothetical protein